MSGPQQWPKAELEAWCRGWSRTPITTLRAFIDAGFCSDELPLREETRLLRAPDAASRQVPSGMRYEIYKIDEALVSDTSPVDATEPDTPCLLSEAIARLNRATWDVRAIPSRQDIRILLDALRRARSPEPPKGVRTWYRGWETIWSETAAQWTGEGWYACLGGEDLDCITVSASTWSDLLDEIDDHDKTELAA